MANNTINIGDMRQTGTFRKNTPAPNQSGGSDDHYADLLTCRGRLRKLKGGKANEDGEIVINKGYEWICRYQSAIVIDTDTCLVIGGIFYRINDYEKIEELNHFYRFLISVFQ